MRVFIPRGELSNFEAFVKSRGFQVRPHTSLFVDGLQILHEGHWMAVQFNNGYGNWTVDRRLEFLVSAFESRFQ